MENTKFKVGDRVRNINTEHPSYQDGTIIRFDKTYEGELYANVKWGSKLGSTNTYLKNLALVAPVDPILQKELEEFNF